MSENRTGKLCEAPGCDRKSRSGSSAYCETHYYRLRRNSAAPLAPLVLINCLECGAPTKRLSAKYCSGRCGERYARNTPPEKQKGRTPPIAMVEAENRIWLTVPNFPDYQISNDGRLRRSTPGSNSKAGLLIRPKLHSSGYPEYGLNAPDGRRAHFMAHRLVALTYLPPPQPDQIFVLHKDDNRLDARDTNLRWGTPQDNMNDAIRNGKVLVGALSPIALQPWDRPRGEGHPFAKLTEDQVRIILRAPESSETLGERYNVSKDAIMAIRRGKNWRHVTDPAYGAALIEGARNDPRPPSKRKSLSAGQRFELLKREDYRCHLCKGLIYPGQGWDISHEIPIALGGADDETNRRAAHRKCHHVHTATVDIPAIARAKRIRAKHFAGHVSARPMAGGRNDFLKRKMNGTTVVRATGQPWQPNRYLRGIAKEN